MTLRILPLRPLALAAILFTTGAAHAAITSTTSATGFQASISSGPSGTDNYADLTINTFLTGPLSRSAGNFGYSVDTNPSQIEGLFVIPNAGNPALSTTNATDSLVFDLTGSSVLGFGGNFFGSNALGEVAGGTLQVTVTDVANNSFTQSFTLSSSTSNFIGVVSDGSALASVKVTAVQPASINSLWPTLDNVTLAATVVPEPSGVALLLAAAGLLGVVARRRA